MKSWPFHLNPYRDVLTRIAEFDSLPGDEESLPLVRRYVTWGKKKPGHIQIKEYLLLPHKHRFKLQFFDVLHMQDLRQIT